MTRQEEGGLLTAHLHSPALALRASTVQVPAAAQGRRTWESVEGAAYIPWLPPAGRSACLP